MFLITPPPNMIIKVNRKVNDCGLEAGVGGGGEGEEFGFELEAYGKVSDEMVKSFEGEGFMGTGEGFEGFIGLRETFTSEDGLDGFGNDSGIVR